MRLLFVKHSLVWPRSSGHDVHTFYMMKACAELGHEVVAGDRRPIRSPGARRPAARDTDSARRPSRPTRAPFAGDVAPDAVPIVLGRRDAQIAALQHAVADVSSRTRSSSSASTRCPTSRRSPDAVRIWYAADEWVLHHLSQLQSSLRTIREHLWAAAATKALYERAHRHVVDRAWVVSESDRRAMRLVAGMQQRGRPAQRRRRRVLSRRAPKPVEDRTAVFWGRLDFGPNIQALEWFCGSVWPRVRQSVPDARFTIIGFQPTDEVQKLAGRRRASSLLANVRDLRSDGPPARGRRAAVRLRRRHQEQAARSRGARPADRLHADGVARLARHSRRSLTASSPEEFAAALVGVWSDAATAPAARRGRRDWVVAASHVDGRRRATRSARSRRAQRRRP